MFFFFNDTATTEIYTLSLHDALPISTPRCCLGRSTASRRHWGTWGELIPPRSRSHAQPPRACERDRGGISSPDRKSTRLNSSHSQISYAVFCLKKKKTKKRMN